MAAPLVERPTLPARIRTKGQLMSAIQLGRLAAATTLAAASLVAFATSAGAEDPSGTGCPAAYQTLSVEWLESQSPNYRLPRQLDEAGNNDGYVCGRPTNDQAAANFCGGPCPVPQLYDFQENDRTPAHKA
jgi:hypothetical protein